MVASTIRLRATLPARPDLPWSRCLLAALPAWVVARLIVLATFALSGKASSLVWDAAWYHNLGVHGYAPYGADGSRFFPLLPAVIQVGSWLGLPVPAWQLGASWLAALFFAGALVRLTVREAGDEAAGRRAAWLIQLVPGANVLALGYTEALAGLLAVLYFLALRSERGARLGFVAGVLSGLVRPTGPLLALPGVIEAVRCATGGLSGVLRAWRSWLVALAPVIGTGAYLAWTVVTFGDPLTPYRAHSATDLRGGVASGPWEFLVHTSAGGYPWPLNLALLVVTAVALYLAARRLPVSYLAWAVAMVGLAVTAWGLHSLPRYLAAVFPLWMALAIAVKNRVVFVALLAVSAAGFTWVAWLTLTPGGPVP
jgi:hypothetical protein